MYVSTIRSEKIPARADGRRQTRADGRRQTRPDGYRQILEGPRADSEQSSCMRQTPDLIFELPERRQPERRQPERRQPERRQPA